MMRSSAPAQMIFVDAVISCQGGETEAPAGDTKAPPLKKRRKKVLRASAETGPPPPQSLPQEAQSQATKGVAKSVPPHTAARADPQPPMAPPNQSRPRVQPT